VVLVVAGVLAGCGGDDEPAATTTAPETTTTAAPPSTTEPPGTPIDVTTLTVGNCFEERVLPNQGATDVDENQTVLVDCADPHLNEVYLVTEMPDEIGVPFPGTEAITDFADQACLDGFEEFIGLGYVESVFEIGYTTPTEETWVLPDRTITCFVFHREGTKVSGTAEGTAQ
jgi:hypothetical protein